MRGGAAARPLPLKRSGLARLRADAEPRVHSRTPGRPSAIRLHGTMGDPNAPRRFQPPLLDALGKLCTDGKQLADYLWQGPDDAGARQKILDILAQIAQESAKQGRREGPRLCEGCGAAAKGGPSPQQVDMLVNGFDRLVGLWQAAKSGLL